MTVVTAQMGYTETWVCEQTRLGGRAAWSQRYHITVTPIPEAGALTLNASPVPWFTEALRYHGDRVSSSLDLHIVTELEKVGENLDALTLQ